MSEDIQVTRKHAINKKRKAREARYLKGGCGAMVFLTFILPLLVVGLNYFFGWKVAVIGFPILTYLSRNIFPSSNNSKKSKLQRLMSYPLKFAIFVVPAIAVFLMNKK